MMLRDAQEEVEVEAGVDVEVDVVSEAPAGLGQQETEIIEDVVQRAFEDVEVEVATGTTKVPSGGVGRRRCGWVGGCVCMRLGVSVCARACVVVTLVRGQWHGQ